MRSGQGVRGNTNEAATGKPLTVPLGDLCPGQPWILDRREWPELPGSPASLRPVCSSDGAFMSERSRHGYVRFYVRTPLSWLPTVLCQDAVIMVTYGFINGSYDASSWLRAVYGGMKMM